MVAACLVARPVVAQTALSGDTIHITKATGHITIDGDLSDEAWQHATRIDKWYETQPGDNTEPKVKNVGYLTFDDHFLYAAFEFEDPNPSAMRAPFADRDNIGNGFDDYAGILLDARNTGSTAAFFVVTPRNVQYDSITDDSSGEDASPDFYWDSATKINAHGWTLEIRIPFSSIRYRNVDPQTWRILLYRNYPRDRHYQFFSARIPRDSNCFVCRSNVLTGLERLPSGGHIVIAPYASGNDACAVGRRRRAARKEHVRRARRRRRQVPPQRRQRPRSHDQTGFFAGGVRHRADRHQPALRAVLSREASVFPGRRRHVRDADPGRVHPYDHRSDRRRPRDRQGRGIPVHRGRRRRRRRRERRDPRARRARRSRRTTSDRRCSSAARRRTSACRSSACWRQIARTATATVTTASRVPIFNGV